MPKHHKTTHHYASHYKVGLGDDMLFRSRIIFVGLIGILFLSSGTAIYAGIKNGSIQKNIIEPSYQLVAAIGDSFKESTESAKPNYGNVININNVSGTTDLLIESSPKPTSKPAVQQAPKQKETVIYYTTPSYAPRPQPSMESYEESVRKMREEADKRWAEALKRQEELSNANRAKNDAWFEQKKAENETKFQQSVAESQARLEAWKKEHGF